jgi:hypothetical protein
MIASWLDEEWTPLHVHQELGAAAGDAYVACRKAGDDDMSSLVLGLSNELLAFNYRETFVNAFEVRARGCGAAARGRSHSDQLSATEMPDTPDVHQGRLPQARLPLRLGLGAAPHACAARPACDTPLPRRCQTRSLRR